MTLIAGENRVVLNCAKKMHVIEKTTDWGIGFFAACRWVSDSERKGGANEQYLKYDNERSHGMTVRTFKDIKE